jgi:hypothetical protein
MGSRAFKVISQEEYQSWFEHHFHLLQHRSPYHHPAWLEAVGKGVHFEVCFIGIYEGDDLVGAVPGFLTRRGPFRLFGSPLRGTMTSSLGPVGLSLGSRTEDLVDLITACNSFVRKQWGVVYSRFTLRDAPAVGKLALEPNWVQQRPGSYRLGLSRAGIGLPPEHPQSSARRDRSRAFGGCPPVLPDAG